MSGVQDENRVWVLRTGTLSKDGRAMYLSLDAKRVTWSWDIRDAVRFSRRQDAEAYRDVHVTGLGAVSDAEAEEHDFG